MPSTEPPKNYEQFALRAIPLLQSAEAELRGAAEERKAYTESLDGAHSRMSRMDVKLDAIIKHFNITTSQTSGRGNSERAGMNGHSHPSGHSFKDYPSGGAPPGGGDDDEITLHGRKVPLSSDGTVALTKSDFAMLKTQANLTRIGLGIGEKVLIAGGAAIVMTLATLFGAWIHGAYVDVRHLSDPAPHVAYVAPAMDLVGPTNDAAAVVPAPAAK